MFKIITAIFTLLFFNTPLSYGKNKSYTAKEIEEYVSKHCLNLKTEQDAMNCANEFLSKNQGATFIEDDPYYKKKYQKKVEKRMKQQNK